MTQISISTIDKHKKENVNTLLEHALQREREVLKLSLKKTREQLSFFENKHQLSSEDFFQQYQSGATDDSDDVVDWAGEYQMYLSIKEQVANLEDVEVCS
jgi:hypothetical protein